MPVAIALIGILLLVAAWQNTIGLLGQTLANDFDARFMAWLGVVFILGIVGYMSPSFRTPSRALLLLILVGYILSNGGLLQQFQQQLAQPAQPDVGAAQQGPSGPAPVQISGGSTTSGSSTASGASGILGLGGILGL